MVSKRNVDFARLRRKAGTSTCKAMVGAVAVGGSGPLAYSRNRHRFSRYGGGVHAEQALMARFGRRISTIIICRVAPAGHLLPISPCATCSRKASELGIGIVSLFENQSSSKVLVEEVVDPDLALTRMREITKDSLLGLGKPEDFDEMVRLFDKLDEWLSSESSLPTRWNGAVYRARDMAEDVYNALNHIMGM